MCFSAESNISARPSVSGAQCVEAAEALFRQKATALIHNQAIHKLLSLIFESLSQLHREKQQVMKIMCKDFNALAFFPTAVMLFHLYKFRKSQTLEDDTSSSTSVAPFIAGSSFTVRTKTILEGLQLLIHFTIFIQLSPFAEITLSPVQSIRKARKQNGKKHETRHLTSEENIENASEEMRLKVGRECTQKEKETIRRAVAGFLTGTF